MSRKNNALNKYRKAANKRMKKRKYTLKPVEGLERREMMTASPVTVDVHALPEDYRSLIASGGEHVGVDPRSLLVSDAYEASLLSLGEDVSPGLAPGGSGVQRRGGLFNSFPIRSLPFEPLHNPSDGGGSNETLVQCGNICPAEHRAEYMGIEDDSAGMVYLDQGEFTISRTDLSVPSTGIDFEFTRTYRSGNDFDSFLGRELGSHLQPTYRTCRQRQFE